MSYEPLICNSYNSVEVVGVPKCSFKTTPSPSTRTITPPPNPDDCFPLSQMQSLDGSQNSKLGQWVTTTTPIDSFIPNQLNSSAGGPEITVVNQAWSEQKEAVVSGPYNYLLQNPGKGVRAQVIQAFNVWMDVPMERLKIIADSVDMLHSASLLIDDIQDNSTLRRGLPVAHSIYGVAQTINSANYYYFRAMKELEKLESTEAIMHFNDELLQLHRGQGLELHWRDSILCPTEEEYLDMASKKTGGLFRLSIKLMQTQSRGQVSSECVRLAGLLGLIFQIRDDYQNLCSNEYTNNKGFCEDLTEGKLSFPAIHCIRHDPDNQELLNILRQRPVDTHIKLHAVQRMRKTGSLDYTRTFLDTLLVQGRQLIDIISNNPETGRPMSLLLNKLAV